MTVVIDMEITSTNRYGLDLDQDLIVLDLRFGDLANLHQAFSLAIFYDGFHRFSFIKSPFIPLGFESHRLF
jgi:hypothetical protein